MSWRKGFFRLWVLFTVLWVIGAGFGGYVYGGWKPYQDASRELARLDKFERANEAEKVEMVRKDPYIGLGQWVVSGCAKKETLTQCVNSSRERMKTGLKISGAIAIAVPAALLALGAALAWVFKGFRQRQDNAGP